MEKVDIRYTEYDNKIEQAQIQLNEDYRQTIMPTTVTNVVDGADVTENIIKLSILDSVTEIALVEKNFTKAEMSRYIKLLQRLIRDI